MMVIKIFMPEDGSKLCYMNDDYENWFQPLAEWRDSRIDSILDDDNSELKRRRLNYL
jgi:ABC-type cobalt transport system substrate-binding protein